MVGSRRASMVLPEPGRAHHEHIVTAARRNLKGPFCLRLSLNVRKVQIVGFVRTVIGILCIGELFSSPSPLK